MRTGKDGSIGNSHDKLSVHAERVILAAALVPSDDFGPEGPLAELERLTHTAG